jgi:hypothetical protein
MKKKAQVWTIDFIIALIIFIMLVLVAFRLLASADFYDTFEPFYRESISLSESLISSGKPSSWNSTNVIIPGIANNNRINESKLLEFDKISYSNTKSLFHISADYLFYFRNATNILNISGRCSRGYNVTTTASCEPNILNLTYSNFLRMDRIVIINSSIIRMVIYTWS